MAKKKLLNAGQIVTYCSRKGNKSKNKKLVRFLKA